MNCPQTTQAKNLRPGDLLLFNDEKSTAEMLISIKICSNGLVELLFLRMHNPQQRQGIMWRRVEANHYFCNVISYT